jgi:hypothetical protein
MRTTQVHLNQSLRRTQTFLVENADAVAPANATDWRRQLDKAIADIDAASAEQGTLLRDVRGEVQRRGQLEQHLVVKLMTPLSKFARASMQGTPEFAALTPSSRSLTRERLVQAARSMADAAEKHVTELEAQFPAGFLAQLRAAADAVQASLDARAALSVKGTGATLKIAVAARDGRRAIAALDGIIGHLIAGNERLLREWRAAKRVRRADSSPAAGSAAKPAEAAPPSAPAAQEVNKAVA